MNEVMNAILERRSCKKYLTDPVPQALLDEIALAGAYAPNGRARQAGKIVMLTDPQDVALLEGMNAEILGNLGSHPFYGAPAVLLVLADSTVPTWIEDGSLVLGNMLLAAHSLGLGACWIHRAREEFDSPAGKALLAKWGIPEVYRGIGHCIVGYPALPAKPAAPRKADFIVKP